MSFSPGAGDATTTTKGIVQLTGALGGTASAPTVPGLAAKADTTTVQAALDTKQPIGDYPTAQEVGQQISSETAGLATISDITTTTQYHKNIFILSSPTSPDPAGATQGDILFVPVSATLPTTWTFTGAGLATNATITTSTAAPNSFGQVSGAPLWDGADILIANNSTVRNVRPEAVGPATGEWSFGFQFMLGANGDPALAPQAGAPFLYGLTAASGAHARLTLSNSGQIQFRNAAGTTLSTSGALSPGVSYFVTLYGIVGTDMTSVRVRNLTDNSLFYTNDRAVGVSSSLYTIICGRQSTLEFLTTMKIRRMVYATAAQELYEW